MAEQHKLWDDIPEEERTSEDGYREALRRIEAWKGEILNLTGLKLEVIPPEIRGLSGLMNLSLDGNQISNLHPLEKLTGLKGLGLGGNKISNLQPLEGLTDLTTLLLNNNQISSLQALERLTELSTLWLNGNKISNLKPLEGLTRLTKLWLSHTQISNLKPLERLTMLKELRFNNNQVSNLKPLEGLTGLTVLWLGNNQTPNLQPLERLTGLTKLWLGFNQISNIQPLAKLTRLTELDLNDNQISNLQPLEKLTELKKLNLSDNKNITSLLPLQDWLNTKPKVYLEQSFENGLHLRNTTIQDLPNEVIAQGSEAILEHYLNKETGSRTNHTGRILIVGQGRAGKTSLKRKIENPNAPVPSPLQAENDSTVGIQIVRDYKVPAPAGSDVETYDAHVWDFGGQEEQHLTHQYFFGRYSLYVVVVNISEGPGELNYWLRLIDLHGKWGKGADGTTPRTPVVIVLNEKEMAQPADAALDSFQEAYPDLRLEKVSVDMARPWRNQDQNDPRFSAEVLRVIHREFAGLPRIGRQVPAPTVPLLERINAARKQQRRYLTVREFTGWCADEGVTDEGIVSNIIDYFKTLGEVIHFAPRERESTDFGNIRDFIIIDPAWATEAIYFLLGRQEIKTAQGRFDGAVLTRAWKHYDTEEARLLKDLLMEDALEVCFEAPNAPGHYIAASLLPTDNPGLPFTPQADRGIRLRLHYPKHIPVGLVTRLIVRLHHSLDAPHFYRNGAILIDHDGKGAVAKVELDVTNQHYINVFIDRGGVAGRSFLEAILREVNAIHKKSFRGIDYERLVPCTCDPCRAATLEDVSYYSLEVLDRREMKGIPTMDCTVSDEQVPIHELLGQVRGPEEMRRRKDHMTFEGSPEAFKQMAGQTIVNAKSANVNTGSGKQQVAAPAPAPTPSFWAHTFEPEHRRGLIITGVVSVASLILAAFYLPKEWLSHAGPIALVVFALGVVWALTRKDKYFAFAKTAFFTGFGLFGLLSALPQFDGFLRASWAGEDGELGLIGRLVLDSPVALQIAVVLLTTVITLACLYFSHQEGKKKALVPTP